MSIPFKDCSHVANLGILDFHNYLPERWEKVEEMENILLQHVALPFLTYFRRFWVMWKVSYNTDQLC